ncbi:MAG: aminoacyl-tRNA hydrolase [archaeon]
MYLIVGLGNPGKKYKETYHNIGFRCLDEYAKVKGVKIKKNKAGSKIYEGQINGNKVILAKPQTYMNLSGQSVVRLVNKFNIDINNILIIYDDIDLNLGAVRFRNSGSAGTHNGMRNIIKMLNTIKFPRLRVGIGRPQNSNVPLDKYVLSKMSKNDMEEINKSMEKIVSFIDEFIEKSKLENKSI